MSNKGLVLITDECDSLLKEGLQKLGYAVHYLPEVTQQEIENTIQDYTGIIITSKTILNKQTIEKATALKFIARAGSGMENVDVRFAEQKDIRCINSPEGNSNSVAEHAVGFLLSLYHHIPRSFNEIRNGEWNVERNRVNELEGRTIGIIGYGNTGSAFARKLSVFGVTVLAYDKYKKNFSDEFAKESAMEEIFSSADVLSLHIPLTDETQYLVNEDFISRFKNPFYLLNTSRGKIVNASHLISAMKNEKISGAALDVLENEDLKIYSAEEKKILNDLIQAGEIILTPHIAGKSFQSKKKFAEILLRKITER